MIFDWLGSLPSAAAQGMIWGVMAIGVYITYRILDIADLTVDGSLVTGAAVCAVMITNGYNVWLSLLAAIAAGMLTGLITGVFHTLMGIPAILSGILSQLILWSVNLKIMGEFLVGKANIALPVRKYLDVLLLASYRPENAIVVVICFVVVLIALLYWFFGTELGISLRATGNNQSMSKAQGININLTKILGLMISNGLVALAGALLAQYQGFSDISMGRGAIVIGLAAVIIGEAVVSKLTSNLAVRLLGVVLGGVIYYFVYQTVIFLGLDADLLKMLSALVVAIFLALPYWKEKLFSKGRAHHA